MKIKAIRISYGGTAVVYVYMMYASGWGCVVNACVCVCLLCVCMCFGRSSGRQAAVDAAQCEILT